VDLAAAVAPTTLARQRTLPVVGPLAALFPDGALVRGRAVACRGVAATSLALALAAEATTAGAWLAVVDVPWLGVEAAAELGIPLERVVRVDPGPSTGSVAAVWADLVAAVLDGFELVVTRIPRHLTAAVARRVQSRLQAREGVLLAVGGGSGPGASAGPMPVELTVEATAPRWEGVEQGWGHLHGRRVTVVSSGRRVPRPRQVDVWLPGPGGGVAAVVSEVAEPPPVLRSVG
jgi:hypothetical protein